MPATLEGQLVVAISSRALFDFEEESRVFEDGDDRAYMQLQLQRVPGRRMRIGTALVTARSATAHERAIRTLMDLPAGHVAAGVSNP